MISVAEATARIVGAFGPVESERVAIGEAHGRVLATAVRARMTQPPAPMSAMDGYAVRASDTPGTLSLIGSAPAGHPFSGSVKQGETVRIFTGGVVPQGADAIVIQEDTEAHGERIAMNVAAKPGRHIRPAGLDFREGDVLASEGKRLTPRDLSLIAAGDVGELVVRRKPLIAIAATGDELSAPGQPRKAGGIVASSGYGLKAMIECWGGSVRDLGILPDRIEAIQSIERYAQDADLVVTLGGASVGDHDLIQKALGPKGFVLDFWKIAMRPGKPLIFGKLGDVPLIGLPGNPVSALVCATLFVQAAVNALLGAAMPIATRSARLSGELGANDSRQDYLRAVTSLKDGQLWVKALDVQDSSMLGALAKADALIVRAAHAEAVPDGTPVEILLL